MKQNSPISPIRKKYLRDKKIDSSIVKISRAILLLFIIFIWELFAYLEIIDPFIFCSPSRIILTIKDLFVKSNLFYHIGITLYETLLGFIIASGLGYVIALMLWWSDKLRRILEPYIVVLNSLPKIALGPIIIVWFGSGSKSIVFMAILIGIIVAIITMLNGFLSADKDKILLLKSMGANKFQIMNKLIIPSSLSTLISMLKINVGMAWIGSIMGEYLVSKAGLGYLIVYGGQVFKLDLVMASTVILCILSALMYLAVSVFEKIIIKHN